MDADRAEFLFTPGVDQYRWRVASALIVGRTRRIEN
jgi:hypothetical protein